MLNSEMWSGARALDLDALNWINHSLGRPWFDSFWVMVTTVRTYILPGASGLGFLLARGGKRGRAVLIAVALSVLSADALSSRAIKPLVGRIRPCNTVSGLRLPDGTRGTLSFPSSHATNSAAVATVVSNAFPATMPYCAAMVLLVGFSRVYLGLHYPSDVLGGYLIGVLIGLLCWRGVVKLYLQSTTPAREGPP